MVELDPRRNTVRGQPWDSFVSQLAGKSEERTQQATLRDAKRPRFHAYIGSNTAATVDDPPYVCLLLWANGPEIVLVAVQALRTAVSVIVVKTPVGVITLNQATRRRVVLCRS